MIFLFELLIPFATLAVAVAVRGSSTREITLVERKANWIANRKWLTVLLVGVVVFGINAALSLFVHMPKPYCTDEYSYLFAADTFANGRLTNPTPPMAEHFQSPNILVSPSYQSRYPPGQGLCLAAGQLLAGHAVVGVWLSLAVACAAVCWMLQAWMPPKWALLGSVLAALSVPVVSTWGQSFWGGAVAMTGGALVFGSLRRIFRCHRVRDAAIMGIGLAILANSRPYEGLIASLPVAVLLVIWIFRKSGRPLGYAVRRVVFPIGSVLAVTFAGIAYYNSQLTGNPFLFPYVVVQQQQEPWMPISQLVFSLSHRDANRYADFIQNRAGKLSNLWRFYIRVLGTIPLIALPWALKDRWMRFAAICCLLVFLAFFFAYNHGYAHYVAPIAPLIYLIVTQCIRRLRLFCRGRNGAIRRFVFLLPIAYVFLFVVSMFAGQYSWIPIDRTYPIRDDYTRRLENEEGGHLVFVLHDPRNKRGHDWVYNRADLAAAKVVYARYINPDSNRRLANHFRDRRVWIFNETAQPRILKPYRVCEPISGNSVR